LALLTGCLPASMAPQSVTVGGQTISYALAGSGTTSVVFESGLGDSYGVWAQVFPTVAERTQAFAYDRPTVQGSPRDTVNLVEELRATLQAVDVRPPYVLVGHSVGGLTMEGFARLHPDEVRAWVSIEGRPADLLQVCAAQNVTDCDPPESAASGFAPEAKAEWDARVAAAQQVFDAPPLNSELPVRVLMGTSPNRPEPQDSLVIFQQLLRRNAHATVNGALVEAPLSGHYIHTQQPDLVIRAIEDVLP
jgi:pimeloyl-ACP methyl ester carboxylesterase